MFLRRVARAILSGLVTLCCLAGPGANPFPRIGEIRLNDRLAAKGQAPINNMSGYALSFSPDGSKLAVQFGDDTDRDVVRLGKAAGNREGPAAGAMAVAGGNAAMPPNGAGLWEIRTDLPTKRTARVLLCLHRERLGALHGFIKKTRATLDEDLVTARKRQKEVAR